MMKTIDKMTDQEIYDLTDEQVEKLIVIRCAEEGVRFIDEPPVMKTYGYKSISPSHFFYYLEGLNIAVLDQNDAIKIAKLLSEFDLYRTRYDFTISNELEFSKSVATGEVTIPSFFLSDDQSQCKHDYCKLIALISICSRYEVDLKNSLVIGDGENDICCIRKAGIGISFCSTHAMVDTVADYIVKKRDFQWLIPLIRS